MAVSDLVADYTEIAEVVSNYLGYPYSPIATEEAGLTLWDALQLRNVQKAIRWGYRRVMLNPPAMPIPGTNDRRVYRWRFLRTEMTLNAWATVTGTYSGTPTAVANSVITVSIPTYDPEMIGKTFTFTDTGATATIVSVTSTTITVNANMSTQGAAKPFRITSNGDYRLPDNVRGIEGKLRMASGQGFWLIDFIDEETMTLLRQQSTATGIPCVASTEPRFSTGAATATVSANPGYAVSLHPIPSENFTLSYRGIVVPNALSTSLPSPLGNAIVAQAVLSACVAEAELLVLGRHGEKWEEFLINLQAAIESDMDGFNVQNVGLPASTMRLGSGGDYVVEAPA